MTEQYEKTKKWYRLLKQNSRCIVCEHEEGAATPQAEFHHVDAKTKKDCVSRFVGRNQPVAALVEVLKCVPLCHFHHTDLHRQRTPDSKYDFAQPHYVLAQQAFHYLAIETAPEEAFVSDRAPPKPYVRRDQGRQLQMFQPRF